MKSKTKLFTNTATAALVLSSQNSSALTNMRDASFSHTETDFTQTSLHDEFKISRYYNSRSDRDGMVGYGWCLSLEKRIRKLANGKLALFECGNTDEIIYKRSPEHSDQWLAENAVSDSLASFSNGTLLRRTARGTMERYGEASGRLLGATDKAGRTLGLSYDREERLLTVTAESGAVLRFSYIGKRLSRIGGPLTVSYQHNQQNLMYVEINGRVRDSYKYDELHNLIEIKKSSQTLALITYDSEKDQVTSVTNGAGCREDYSYSSSEPSQNKDFPLHATAEARRRCGKEKIKVTKFEFWFENLLGKDARYLARMRVSSSTNFTEVAFHPNSGAPIELNRSGVVTRMPATDDAIQLSITKR